jgi:beta-glucosidase
MAKVEKNFGISHYLSKMKRWIFMVFLFWGGTTWSQLAPYKNPELTTEVRVKDLLSRMTWEEKFYQLFMIAHDRAFQPERYQHGIFGIEISIQGMDQEPGQQMLNYNATWTARKQIEEINKIQDHLVNGTRLGIPAIFFGEALHGVVGKGAVSYPQSIALAASFDTLLMSQVAHAIALESQQRGWRQVLSPVVNIATDVRWGRVEETYGEDPFLASIMGAAFVRPFEQRGIVTTPKHFVANVGDGGRDSYPIHADEAYLKRVHYPPFRACFDAGSRSVMTSYNSLNGVPNSMNHELLNVVLKDQWKFQGFVISDAGAVGGANVLHNTSPDYPTSGKLAIENGMDVIFQTSIQHDVLFSPLFKSGKVRTSAIDSAVMRVLRVKFELGLFEHPYAAYFEVNQDSLIQLSLQAAEQSMVLLKNHNHVCPIEVNHKKILVIGDEAIKGRQGGYSGTGVEVVNYWDGMKKQWGDEVELIYHPGWTAESNYIPLEQDWNVQWWSNTQFEGKSQIQENRKTIDFHYTFMDPFPNVSRDYFSLIATASWIPEKTQKLILQIEGNDGYRFWQDGRLLVDHFDKTSYHQDQVAIEVKAGQPVQLKVAYYEGCSNPELHIRQWIPTPEKQIHQQGLLKLAKECDYVLVFAGIEEGEFQDRSKLGLKPAAAEMIRMLGQQETPVIVALVGGSAITMEEWQDEADAIWMNWYGGEQQGNAFAHLLSGKADPSGRLPITFPLREGQLPLSYWHEPTGRGDDYIDGSGLPLYPFGYGLSYADFSWGELVWKDPQQKVLSCRVKNISPRAGYVVPQLYLQPSWSATLQPVLRLVGVQKHLLQPNEEKELLFTVTHVEKFLNLSDEHLPDGNYQWAIGSSSRSLKRKLSVNK